MIDYSKPVLFVEDDADDRFIMRRAWQDAGIAQPLREIEGGQQAIDYLREAAEPGRPASRPEPAMAIVDLKLAGRSGLEVLAWIRGSAAWRRLPVIVLTASTSPVDVAEAYRLGANSFLVKPSSIQDLVEVLVALNCYWLRFNEFPERG